MGQKLCFVFQWGFLSKLWFLNYAPHFQLSKCTSVLKLLESNQQC